ncbi:MAG: M20 family metallopeptidase [Candidatus Nitrosocaldus sp.]|nr:M20 family metallopeptidase [Candidatus Nitrosocaldus sp.]MCS7141111.1 M20 family metallopeptidase [Candidatus Nitrosocaldus sp.]MDW8000075.1 M20 family metallopeptidase [Candidatus Nitrosocaldus sp.]MDW8275532.1 M20 family metallopeptidase [Candidatus Nitrosocaldus sp.]
MLGKVKDAVEREMVGIVEDAAELIRIPSRNPPGEERRCAEYIYSRLREFGLNAFLLHEPFTDRPQVIAYPSMYRIDELEMMLNGHMDTVPEGSAEAWSIDPFSGLIRDGRIYGRGSVDMKSALAIMMHICRIVEDARVMLCFAVGEERAEPGTSTMLRHLRHMGARVRYGVVMEPTSLRIARCQRGALWLRVRVRGRAAHASIPYAGTNAILKACRAVDALNAYMLTGSRHERGEGGVQCTPSCSITMIDGGVKENIIPDECTLVIDRRVTPYEDVSSVIDGIRELLDKSIGDYSMDIIASRRAVCIDGPSMLISRLSDALGSIGVEPVVECFPGSTDNEFIVGEGIESIVWGPGSIEQAHAVDEHISIEELNRATCGLALLLMGMSRDS